MAKSNRKHQQAHEADAELHNNPEIPAVTGPEVVKDEEPATEVIATITLTAEELIKKYGNKSNAIRALSADGMTRSEVAKALGIRYQHVNNVLGQILKRPIKAQREAEKNGNNHTEEKAGD